ncbi:hypothetical protein C8J57DRAFT_1613035 [Mycena rebaudengoi]|nr:hypothetical protein C8J57DRAFT_1613035 [Mycena rebaudengoi]
MSHRAGSASPFCAARITHTGRVIRPRPPHPPRHAPSPTVPSISRFSPSSFCPALLRTFVPRDPRRRHPIPTPIPAPTDFWQVPLAAQPYSDLSPRPPVRARNSRFQPARARDLVFAFSSPATLRLCNFHQQRIGTLTYFCLCIGPPSARTMRPRLRSYPPTAACASTPLLALLRANAFAYMPTSCRMRLPPHCAASSWTSRIYIPHPAGKLRCAMHPIRAVDAVCRRRDTMRATLRIGLQWDGAVLSLFFALRYAALSTLFGGCGDGCGGVRDRAVVPYACGGAAWEQRMGGPDGFLAGVVRGAAAVAGCQEA